MLKKTIEYTDYNGKARTGVFYFNLSTAEMLKLEMSTMFLSEDGETTTGGLQQHIQDVIDSRSGKRIIAMFDMFVDASYGARSEDGSKFVKNEALLADFKSTPAYDSLFMELVTDAGAGAKFVSGIMPPELFEQVAALKAQQATEETNEIDVRFQDAPRPPVADLPGELEPVDATPHLLAAETFGHDKPKTDKNVPRAILIAKMKIGAGKPVVIDDALMDALTDDELNQAMENGSTLA